MSQLTAKQIYDNDLINRGQKAVSNVLAEQSWFEEKKNTLAAVSQGVIQLANVGLFAAGITSVPLLIAVAAIVIVAEIIFHAATRGPVTPSGAEKIVNRLTSDTILDEERDWQLPDFSKFIQGRPQPGQD